jgi:hypothetical protein
MLVLATLTDQYFARLETKTKRVRSAAAAAAAGGDECYPSASRRFRSRRACVRLSAAAAGVFCCRSAAGAHRVTTGERRVHLRERKLVRRDAYVMTSGQNSAGSSINTPQALRTKNECDAASSGLLLVNKELDQR